MYPTTIYRVVAKAFITNSEGKVLVVKENHDFWSLPGGGLEHGESAKECLMREIEEELGINDAHIGEIAYSTTVYLDQRDFWMTWIVYKASIATNTFSLGDGVTDARFIDISEIQNTNDLLEKLVIETAQSIK